jgi:DNA-binding transcriptional LysR family regulator
MRAFSQAAGFEPRRLNTCITIAANDLQRDLLLPGLLRRLRMQAPGLSLRVIPSGAPQAALLRDQACDLLITPRPPEATDVLQQRLFEDPYRVFYDPAERQAPLTLDDYLAAEHVSVLYEPRRSLDVDEHLQAMGHRRRFVAWVPGLAALGAMLRGGPWLATAPGLLAQTSLQGLAHSPPPMPLPLLPMYLVWHQRHHRDPAHQWLRSVLVAQARADLGRASPSAPTPGSG